MSLLPSTSEGCMSNFDDWLSNLDRMSNFEWIGVIALVGAGACLLYKWGQRAPRL